MKSGTFRSFVKMTSTITVAAILAFIASAIVIWKKNESGEYALSTSIGYPCWAIQTVGLSFVAGYIASSGASGNKVLCAEIATMLVAVICAFFGGKIFKSNRTTSK